MPGVVAGAVGRATKVDAAKAWLISRLVDGPVDTVASEEEGRKAGHSLKNLKTAKKAYQGQSLRLAGKWLWHLPMAVKPKDDDP